MVVRDRNRQRTSLAASIITPLLRAEQRGRLLQMCAMMVINVHPDCSKLTPGINADELITILNLSIHTFTRDLFIQRNLFGRNGE